MRRGKQTRECGKGEEGESIGVIYKRGEREGEFEAWWEEREGETKST